MSDEKAENHCSFCAKAMSVVEKLIEGPSVWICNECVDLCHGILTETKMDKLAKRMYEPVRLIRPITITKTTTIVHEPGALGMIVECHPDGVGFEVELTEDCSVISVTAADIEELPGA